MRFIDIDDWSPPSAWLKKSEESSAAVMALPADRRAAAINQRRKVWKELKDVLKSLSNNKCWYCETIEHRSDTAVDHYRPKNRVLECPSHPGYWWLAFDWSNFRFSCQYCNEFRTDTSTGTRRGKGTTFPLLDETKRVFSPGDLSSEEPVLLDPTNLSDVSLLSFDLDGTAMPTYREESFPILFKRADVSIRTYNLNHTDTKERRQVQVCNKIKLMVKRGDKYFPSLANGDQLAKSVFSDLARDFKKLISETEEYSAAARAVLRTYRDKDWLVAVLQAC
jgi:uncharacterized protein (TIGR02646 family)